MKEFQRGCSFLFFFPMPKYNTLTQYLLGEQHKGPRWSTRQNQTLSTQGNPSCWRFSAVYFEGRGASACLASTLGEVSMHRWGGFSWAIGREKLWVSSSVGLVAQKLKSLDQVRGTAPEEEEVGCGRAKRSLKALKLSWPTQGLDYFLLTTTITLITSDC